MKTNNAHNNTWQGGGGGGGGVLCAMGPGLPVHLLHASAWALSCRPHGARGNSHHCLHQSLSQSQTRQTSGAWYRYSNLQKLGEEHLRAVAGPGSSGGMLNSHLDFFLPRCSLSTTASSHCTFLLLLGLCSLRTSVSWGHAPHVTVSPPSPPVSLARPSRS